MQTIALHVAFFLQFVISHITYLRVALDIIFPLIFPLDMQETTEYNYVL